MFKKVFNVIFVISGIHISFKFLSNSVDMVKTYFCYCLTLVHLISSWLVWAEIKCIFFLIRPINRFQPVWQSRKQALRSYCLDEYAVFKAHVCTCCFYSQSLYLIIKFWEKSPSKLVISFIFKKIGYRYLFSIKRFALWTVWKWKIASY